MKTIKKFLDFIQFLESEKIKAMIYSTKGFY